MENFGLITYRESMVLYDEKYGSAEYKFVVCQTIAHELAHQWSGNLVTPKFWDDLWLNEGFADYVSYEGVDSVRPEWGIWERFVIDEVQHVMTLDALKSSHPISGIFVIDVKLVYKRVNRLVQTYLHLLIPLNFT